MVQNVFRVPPRMTSSNEQGVAKHLSWGLTLEAIIGVCDVVKRLQPDQEVVKIAATVERIRCQFAHHQPTENGKGGWVNAGQFVGRQVDAAEAWALPECIAGYNFNQVVLQEKALQVAKTSHHPLS